ncbi:Hydrolase (HAD superfamily) [Minicystis rosea]|nr:Hydrolase (HAD superfamily) [Minicystis rosea]
MDVDGTLIGARGTIDPRDVNAIDRARRAGVFVTLATGRLAPLALSVARSLDLEVPLVCADGAALVCPRSGAILEATHLAPSALAALLDAAVAHALAPFLFFADAIWGDASGAAHADLVSAWSSKLTFSACFDEPDRAGAVMAFGIGPQPHVEAAHAAIEGRDTTVDLSAFGLGEGAPWVLRAAPHGVGKHTALARLAHHLGVQRGDVAAVGDWYNDLTMLSWAGHSFAMGGAPTSVCAAAGCVLEATADTGGGIEEAISRWIGI